MTYKRLNYKTLDIANLQDVIEQFNLKSKCRKPEFIYRRYYLYYCLKRCGYNVSHIGRLMDKDHATVLHGLKVHYTLTECKDKHYKMYTDELNVLLEYTDDPPNIFEDIENCTSLKDLSIIKERIAINYY